MNLKKIRKRKGLTQLKVANDLNLAHTTYTAYENGKIQPSAQTLISLAKYFQTTIDNIVGYKNDYLLDTSLLTNTQLELINEIKNASDITCVKLKAYLDGLKDNKN